MAITPRSDVAVNAAYLLANQLPSNPGFKPLLVVAEKEKLQGYMSALKLSNNDLPALVFYDKSGKQVGQVVATRTTITKFEHLYD